MAKHKANEDEFPEADIELDGAQEATGESQEGEAIEATREIRPLIYVPVSKDCKAKAKEIVDTFRELKKQEGEKVVGNGSVGEGAIVKMLFPKFEEKILDYNISDLKKQVLTRKYEEEKANVSRIEKELKELGVST